MNLELTPVITIKVMWIWFGAEIPFLSVPKRIDYLIQFLLSSMIFIRHCFGVSVTLSFTPSIVAFRQFQNEHQILNRTNVGKIPKTIDTVWENERVKKMHVTENEIENIENASYFNIENACYRKLSRYYLFKYYFVLDEDSQPKLSILFDYYSKKKNIEIV